MAVKGRYQAASAVSSHTADGWLLGEEIKEIFRGKNCRATCLEIMTYSHSTLMSTKLKESVASHVEVFAGGNHFQPGKTMIQQFEVDFFKQLI